MNDKEKSIIIEASSILVTESRIYYDQYKLSIDAESKVIREKAFKAYEKYKELDRIVLELNIIAGGL